MYITVRYGDRQEKIFNPYCKASTLLRWIKETCTNNREADIELSDEQGNLKNLQDYPDRYANELLHEREVLILLRVEKSGRSSTSSKAYVPLLKDDESITEDFMSRLSARGSRTDSTPRRQKSGALTRGSFCGDKDKKVLRDKMKNNFKAKVATGLLLDRLKGKPGNK